MFSLASLPLSALSYIYQSPHVGRAVRRGDESGISRYLFREGAKFSKLIANLTRYRRPRGIPRAADARRTARAREQVCRCGGVACTPLFWFRLYFTLSTLFKGIGVRTRAPAARLCPHVKPRKVGVLTQAQAEAHTLTGTEAGRFKFQHITWQGGAGCTQLHTTHCTPHVPLAQHSTTALAATRHLLARGGGPLVQNAPVVAVAPRGAREAHPWVALP